MGKAVDRTGVRYGRLVVIHKVDRRASGGKSVWLCKCDCGNYKEVCGSALQKGHTRSCGCLMGKHRMCQSPEWNIWCGMKKRCHNQNASNFDLYGARGIEVAPEWQSFERFYADMGARPSDNHSLERIDNDGPYAPWNCRWATVKEQANNRRSNHWLNVFGETRTLAEAVSKWAQPLGLSYWVVKARIYRGYGP